MLHRVDGLLGHGVLAGRERIGKLSDLYCDDRFWVARYLVVDTGRWLAGRRVLVAPLHVAALRPGDEEVVLDLTPDEVRGSPGVDSELPVSLQHRVDLARQALWAPRWEPTGLPLMGLPPPPARLRARAARRAEGDPHLRSAAEVLEYGVEALDGEIGHLEDLILADEDWSVRHLVVDTRKWLPGRRVLLAVEWLARVDFPERRVHVDLTREQIRASPAYDPDRPIEPDYERRLREHYGRSGPEET